MTTVHKVYLWSEYGLLKDCDNCCRINYVNSKCLYTLMSKQKTEESKGWGIPSRPRDYRLFINNGREFRRSLLFCCLKERKWQRHGGEPGALVVALWSSGMTGAFNVTLKRRVGEKKYKGSVLSLKKKIHRHINNISKNADLICCGRKCHCADMPENTFPVSTIYRQSGAECGVTIKSKHP